MTSPHSESSPDHPAATVVPTPAPRFDVDEKLPGLSRHALPMVRLHPRAGTPGPRQSHVGGPMLWPADEPWPYCSAPKGCDLGGGKPMVSVAQLFAADFPEITYPAGTDVLQLLWCVGFHRTNAPCRAIWRSATDITGPLLTDPPQPDLSEELPGFYEESIPQPCILHPERVVEYPWYEDLPDDLLATLPDYYDDTEMWDEVTAAPGFKIGGSMARNVGDIGSLACTTCGATTELLLQLDSSEGAGRWNQLGDTGLAYGMPGYDERVQPTSMGIGRGGSHGGFFSCPHDPRHPMWFHSQ